MIMAEGRFKNPLVDHVENGCHSAEQNIDKRSGDQHDGRYGGVGLLVMLESEIVGGVVGRTSTYFSYHHHVDDQYSRRHQHSEHYSVNVTDGVSASQI